MPEHATPAGLGGVCGPGFSLPPGYLVDLYTFHYHLGYFMQFGG
jgi:hypothetical protein